MAASRFSFFNSSFGVLCLLGTLLSLCDRSLAANKSEPRLIEYTSNDGSTIYLDDDRKPALYTQTFGDCLGDSLINVTRFDAAYYRDNMTVIFHLAGNSALTNQSLIRTLKILTAAQRHG